ncbi:MAG: lamin tail domain-containing protein, partial [Planctomycetales bacterium]|nr:lamin tail domain-containing protein [Planctomycetales bacterium]
ATVRYIGIDTPERGQPGYDIATQANADLVQGQTVYLQRDVSDTDRYDRLLRNVYLPDGTWVNGQLVAMGLAQPVRYAPDTAYAAQLEQAARDAALTRSGFWAGGAEAMPYAQVIREANLRIGPDTAFESTRVLPADTPLTVFGRNPDATWFQVRTPARDGGWMAAGVLTLNVAATTVPVVDDISTPPAATATTPAEGSLRIITVDKRAEYIVIRNDGSVPVNLRGWTVVSEKGNQTWKIPFDFELSPGATVTVHALEGANDNANLYSGFGSNIWNNSESDPAVLLNPAGQEVSRH